MAFVNLKYRNLNLCLENCVIQIFSLTLQTVASEPYFVVVGVSLTKLQL